MTQPDEIAQINEQWWQKMVREGCGFTRPWLDLDPALVRQYAQGHLDPVPDPLTEIYPAHLLAGIEGKDVLCLASGGGQQSAVFGLLGARVTVVDLTEEQLAGDRQAAAHYGYQVTTIRADMRDLSCLESDAFDLVYQPPAFSYIPDVHPIYAAVARILRSGGRYRMDACNPAVQFVDVDNWDGTGYRITVPYTVQRADRPGGGPAEFRHFLSDLFNGLIAAGLSIQQVQESPLHLRQTPQAPPGSWEHILMHVPWIFTIVAAKT